MTAARNLLGRVLVSSLMEPDTPGRDALGDLVRGRDLSGLSALAEAHRVGNAVYGALAELDGVDRSELEHLERAYHSALRRHLRALVDVGSLASLMNAGAVPWLVVKGPAISEHLYGPDRPRSYADLDVLVPRAGFRRAVEACVDGGLAVVQTDWDVAVRELAGEVCIILPSGTAMDLHWDLLYHEQSRRAFTVRTDEMFDRAVAADLAGSPALTLDAADTLIHLCLHAAKGGGGRLQWLKDIERSVVVGRPDWGEVVSRSRRWEVALVVGVMLDRARRVLDAPVPDDVRRELGGRPWRLLASSLDHLWPVEKTVGRRAISTMAVRATGRTGWSSARSLATQARISVRPPAPVQPGFEVRRGRDQALEVFLAAVSGGSDAGQTVPVGDLQ